MNQKIKLPPLPEARIVSYQTDSTMRSMELRTYSDQDMQEYARAAIEFDRQGRGEPVTWLLTPQQVMALAEELISGAQTMGGADDDGEESLLRLQVRMPGTVSDDDGTLNDRPVLAFCIDDYPEEGVYPIDPSECQPGPAPDPQPAEPCPSSVSDKSACDSKIAESEQQPAEPVNDDLSLDRLADYIADNWPDKKYSLEEIAQCLHATWPGAFMPAELTVKDSLIVAEPVKVPSIPLTDADFHGHPG